MADDSKSNDPKEPNPYGFKSDPDEQRPRKRDLDVSYHYRDNEPQQHDDGGGGGGPSGPVIGWIIFFLIFGVGNFILYKTTGIFFIPIPRR